ncbi:MAG: CDP-alcohol phosphatidyltransferase family protein [Candidatus Hodarchaeales archaeon]
MQFHRRISFPIVNIVFPIKQITPNRITWFGFFLAIISAFFLAFAEGKLVWLLVASILYWISAITDCIDGQLARKRNVSGKHGEFLDSVLEGGKGILFWFAVGINITQHSSLIWGIDVWFLVAVCLSMLGWLSIGSIYSSWLFQESQPVSHGHVYIAILIMMSNLLELALLSFAVLSTLGMIYTLLEKTFLFSLEE